jgi:hypothetical protein
MGVAAEEDVRRATSAAGSKRRVIEAQGVFYDGDGSHCRFRGTAIETVGLWPNHTPARRALFQRTCQAQPENSLSSLGLASVVTGAARALHHGGGGGSAAVKRVNCWAVNGHQYSTVGSHKRGCRCERLLSRLLLAL